MNKDIQSSGGSGLFGLLGIVFVTLKLTDVIDWSWWWVTLPFWGGLALLAIIGLIMFIVYSVTQARTKRNRYK